MKKDLYSAKIKIAADPGDTNMTKRQTEKNGKGLSIQQASAPCELGWVIAATTDAGLCFLAFGDGPDDLLDSLEERFPEARISPANATFSANMAKIVDFVDGRSAHCGMSLDIQGTPFQQQVWTGLTEIPSGTTLTYSELAERIGRPKSFRAVANACGANPVAVVIPCHRVIRSDGSLGGYRGGIKRKKILLEREKNK